MPAVQASEANISQELERNFRHNAAVNIIEGIFFWFGSSFLAHQTILALYINNLTDSKILIGLLATIGSAGWLLPQLFTSNLVQRLPRKKYMPVNIGLWTERLPVLLLAPATLLALRSPGWALAAFFVLYTWSSVGAGVVAVGWQDMFAKVIPARRRARIFGVTNFVGVAAGIVGGKVISDLLSRYPFPQGYTIAFAIGAGLIFISWINLALVREPAEPAQEVTLSQREYLRTLPAILRADRNFRRYLVVQTVIGLTGMAGGFYAVYTVQQWQLGDSQASAFTISMLVGQALGNLIFGVIGDHKGHKLVIEFGILFTLLALGVALLAVSPAWFHLVFVLAGLSWSGTSSSSLMIALEFSSPELRPTYIGLNNTVRGIAAGLAPIIGGWLASSAGYHTMFGVAWALGILALLLLHKFVQDPRQWVEAEAF